MNSKSLYICIVFLMIPMLCAPLEVHAGNSAVESGQRKSGSIFQSIYRQVYLQPQFFKAVKKGDLVRVQYLLGKGADMNARVAVSHAPCGTEDGHDYTPLHVAAQMGHVEIVRELLSANADVNAVDRRNRTPLFCAVGRINIFPGNPDENNRVEIVKLLLDAGANVDAVDDYDYPLLFAAVEYNQVNIMRVLLDAGADVNVKNRSGMTPLHWVAMLKNFANQTIMAQLLMERGANIEALDNSLRSPRTRAKENKNYAIAELIKAFSKSRKSDLITNTNNTNASLSGTQSERRAEEEWLDISKELLKVVDYPVNVSHPLEQQMRQGVVEEVKNLLAAGADPDVDDQNGNTALHIAAEKGAVGIVKLLLQSGANSSAAANDGDTPLHRAAKHNQVQIIQLLLVANRAQVNAKNKCGNTPLHEAAQRGRKGAAVELIKNGAKLEAVNKKGETPLVLAGRNNAGVDEVIQYALLQRSAQAPSNNNNNNSNDDVGSSGCS